MSNALPLLLNRTVLYAEDEAGIRSNVAPILELFFHRVLIASDGREAWQIYEEESPDMVILDIYMPYMDGLEVVKAIRQKNATIPLIVLSAHRDEEVLWRAVDQKITRYLTKPFSKESLLEALNTAALELAKGVLEVPLGEGILYLPCEKSLEVQGERIALSFQESRLLELFIEQRGRTIPFEQIESHLWGYDAPSKEAIKALIKSLRKKLGKDLIKNHYGIGYTLDSPMV